MGRGAAALVLVATLAAERGAAPPAQADAGYDGRFTFVRLRYGSGTGFWGGRRSGAWSHDYPRADQHLVRILEGITLVDANVGGTRVLDLDDPELFKYPVAYMSEPGFWTMTDREAVAFRAYLLKGGFAIFDDFEREQWNNFAAQIRRVLPDGRFVELDASHPIFDSFFHMTRIDFPHPMYGYTPHYYALFEDNDPSKRVMVIANHDNDVAEYWEWSDTGLLPIDLSNEAYKLGVNYIIYAMTH